MFLWTLLSPRRGPVDGNDAPVSPAASGPLTSAVEGSQEAGSGEGLGGRGTVEDEGLKAGGCKKQPVSMAGQSQIKTIEMNLIRDVLQGCSKGNMKKRSLEKNGRILHF